VRQDPRPNTDKAYIQASIRALINYLTEHNYDHPFSPKILSRYLREKNGGSGEGRELCHAY
jgi:SMC interacting uncharacterized protein involved in chromosome segregation